MDPEKLPGLVQEFFDLRPAAIIERLDLRRPIYQRTAAYGQFGRPPVKEGNGRGGKTFFTWERTDRVSQLKKAVK